MIIDAHIHLFNERIIANVSAKSAMVAELGLETEAATRRIGTEALKAAMDRAGVNLALNLPTAAAGRVSRVNRNVLEQIARCPFLSTAGTLHPRDGHIDPDLSALCDAGVRAIKMCSFSQGFALDSSETLDLFNRIAAFNRHSGHRFFVVLDTFYKAAGYFGTQPQYTTRPEHIGRLVRRYPDVNFVAAHMGGLTAPFETVVQFIPPADNLYLDTSNAAHTLTTEQFVGLLRRHGPERIIFGTDWPWFDPADEIPLIDDRLDRAGFTPAEKARVFGGNAADLLGC